MSKHIRTLGVCTSLLASGLWSTTVVAAPVCFPSPGGVPGESGPPDWWGAAGREDDPRWRGAMTIGHVGDHAWSRALYANDGGVDYLYLNYSVKLDAGTGSQPEDYLYFGFLSPSGASGTGTAFRLTIPTDPATGSVDMQTIQPSQVQLRWKLAEGVAWSPFSVANAGTAPWMQATGRYWVDCGATACNSFTVQLRIPIDAAATPNNVATGLNLPDNFWYWYDLNVLEPGGSGSAHYSFPAGQPFSLPNFLSPAYPAAGQWGEGQIKSAAGCVQGITLSSSQIFVTHGGGPDWTIGPNNVFHAQPVNNSGGNLPGDAVRARFRIADWGSAGVGSNPQWNPVPNCDQATGSGSIANGAAWDLNCSWNPSTAELCEYRPPSPVGDNPPWNVCTAPGTKNSHQCILVDLSAGAGATGDLFFSSGSTYRNMNIVPASRVERQARISFEDIPAPSDGKYVAYLYVETHNMPEKYVPPDTDPDHGDEGSGDPGGNEGGAGADKLGVKTDEAKAQKAKAVTKAKPKKVAKGDEGLLPKAGIPAELMRRLRAGKVSHEEAREQVPTFVVHVWNDTFEKEKLLDGTEVPLLAARPSFGMYLHHVGELEGWAHRLDGADLKMIAPQFYRVEIPASGVYDLTTTIQARAPGEAPLEPNKLEPPIQEPPAEEPPAPEPPKPPKPPKKGCAKCSVDSDVDTLASFGLFALVLGWRRRRRLSV